MRACVYALLMLVLLGCGGGSPTSPTTTSTFTPMWSGSGGIGLGSSGSRANLLNLELRLDGRVVASSTSQTPRQFGAVAFAGQRLAPGRHTLTVVLTQVSSPFEYLVGGASLTFVKESSSEVMHIACTEPMTRVLATGEHVLCSFLLP